MFRALWLGLLLSFAGLAACGTVTMDAAKRKSIQQVSVSKIVAVSPEIYFHGRAQSWFVGAGIGLGGAAGAAVSATAPTTVTEKEQIRAFLSQQQIDVGGIVRAAFVNGLTADPKWSPRLHDQSETHFDLKVDMYGLANKGPLSSDYKPILSVTASLVDKDGNVLWRERDFVANLSSITPEASYAAFLDDPKWFRDGFSVAANEITRSLLGKLK